MSALPGGHYDRAAAARLLARVAGTTPFGPVGESVEGRFLGGVRRIAPEVGALETADGGRLTELQLEYVWTRMRPCTPELVASASYSVNWRDSDGVANVAHCGPLGPVLPVVAREATLAMWRALAANDDVIGAVLSDADRAIMAATTTDKDPVEILRVGIDTTARALVQHAYLADQTPYRNAAEFARGLRDSGIFAVVANTWFWGLQSSTFRRGMIPVRLVTQDDGTVRYAGETSAMLRAMKDTAIADAHETLRRATVDEGLTVEEALRKYDVLLGQISRQYALLPAGQLPRCLANMSVDGVRMLPGVVDTFVETFVQLLELVEIEEAGVDTADEVFEVPDMTCSHCTNTITGVLEALGVRVAGIDLDTKEVVAAFPSDEVRAQSFEAIRGRGYTVVPR
ncbi:heavy-metal-associated domain-containing protein [Kribbella kalugense]|uniref:Copper chaperone CopZ n=1 Tax=Kribbella kalugense TaxID=2512221 RepID=A0A4R7ZXB0_9ACTN|nr:heavy-metal-associated domain-containing protein [Kribbella kalugense]TDW22632.1 copper chaperone CopZ [Kribbella kalugense]